MTAARLQWYALFLAGHLYSIEYRNTHDHANADGLSHTPAALVRRSESSCRCQSGYLPRRANRGTVHYSGTDPDDNMIRSNLVICIPRRPEWKSRVNRRHTAFRQPFRPARNAPRLSSLGYLCRNSAVSASPHPSGASPESHPGIVRMKELARSYVLGLFLQLADGAHALHSCTVFSIAWSILGRLLRLFTGGNGPLVPGNESTWILLDFSSDRCCCFWSTPTPNDPKSFQ